MSRIVNREFHEQQIKLFDEVINSALDTIKGLRVVQLVVVCLFLTMAIACVALTTVYTGDTIRAEALTVALALLGVFCLYIGTKHYFDIQKDIKNMVKTWREAEKGKNDCLSMLD